MSEHVAIEYVQRALTFRKEYPDALEALQRGQLGTWLGELGSDRLAGFLATFPSLLATADTVALGTRHHMNARAVWRTLTTGGEIRAQFDRQLVDGIQHQIERGGSTQRLEQLANALASVGYPLPAGLTLGEPRSNDPFRQFAAAVIPFEREYDMELRFAYSNRYSGIFAMESPRYGQFISGWLDLMSLAHRFDLPATAAGNIRSAFQKYGPQNELHEKWPEWLRRAAEDIRGNVDLAAREAADERERQNRLSEARLAYSRLAGFLDALHSRGLANISLAQLGIADLEDHFNHNKDNDHG